MEHDALIRLYRWQRRLAGLLTPLGKGWATAMRLRRAAYAAGVLPGAHPGRPTVAVGGVGSGGAGKTPLASWLLGWAGGEGVRAALLTRGYGAAPPHLPYLVRPEADPAAAGDEPLLLAQSHPGAVVVADPVRRRAAAWASMRFGPELFVLDDGFQHLAVRRDVNIVCLRAEDLDRGWDKVLPAGTWREGAESLRDAHAFCVKTSGGSAGLDLRPAVRRRLERFGRPVFTFSLSPVRLREVATGRTAADLGGEPYVFLAGLAEPTQAAAAAESYLGRGPAAEHFVADHHGYGPHDLDETWCMARNAEARHVVCTAKDAVKLAGFAGPGVWSLEVEPEFGPVFFSDDTFPIWWQKVWSALARKDERSVLD